MAITPLNGDLTAGIPMRRTETFNAMPDALITGDYPAFGATTDHLLPADAVYAARTVVGLDADGYIVPAITGSVDPEDDVQAVGILSYAVDTTGASAGTVATGVWRTGCFNPDMLVWDDSFDDDEKKRLAFEGAPSPTAIIIRKIKTMTV